MANWNDKLEPHSAQEKSENTPETTSSQTHGYQTYEYQIHERQTPPYNDLPFLSFPEEYETKRTRYWNVPHADNYFDATCRGYEYAFLFIKFLRDYPNDTVETNLLGQIASHIDFKENDNRKGYWVGFFGYLEKVLYEQARVMDFGQEWRRLQDEFEALRNT